MTFLKHFAIFIFFAILLFPLFSMSMCTTPVQSPAQRPITARSQISYGRQLPPQYVIFVFRQRCQTELINHAGSKCNFVFHLMVTAPPCYFTWLCDPYQLISAMATGDKKREVKVGKVEN